MYARCILNSQQCEKWDQWKDRKKNLKTGLYNKNWFT